MSHRFETEKRSSSVRNLIISIAVFVIIAVCFWYITGSVSTKTSSEEKQLLEAAISRGITHCYAIEGVYPESLDYLKEHYGLYYDEDRFFIDYQPIGADIMPDVTVIEKEGGNR